jgi:hypothetical protein
MQAIKPHQNLVLFGVVAVVVIVGGVVWMNNQRVAKASASWSDYFVAMSEQRPDALEDVAQFHEGSSAAWWALQSAGDYKLTSGAQKMFENRDEAKTDLKDAEKHFKEVEQGATNNPELVRRARFGLARVYETMCEIPKATEYYKQVAQAAPDSAIGKLAENRYNELTDESVEKWYNWFERQEPAPPPPPSGENLNPLGDLENLPERPDLSTPFSSPLEGMLSDEGLLDAGPDLAPADQPIDAADETDMPAEPSESSATETTETPASDEAGPSDSSEVEPTGDATDSEVPAESEPTTEQAPVESDEEAPAEAGEQAEAGMPADNTEAPASDPSAEPAGVVDAEPKPEAGNPPESKAAPADEAPAEEAPVEELPGEEQSAGSDESS